MAGEKICPHCISSFIPHPKVGDRQIFCGRESCKRQRKKEADHRWRLKNPDYFKGRYQISTKPRLLKHLHYLRDYRQRKRVNGPFVQPPAQTETGYKAWPVPTGPVTTDIQDKLTLINTIDKPRRPADIQDKLKLVNTINYQLFYIISDIQDDLDVCCFDAYIVLQTIQRKGCYHGQKHHHRSSSDYHRSRGKKLSCSIEINNKG